MNLYTGYFAGLKHVPESIVPISIAQFPIKGWAGLSYPKLFPPKDLLAWVKQSGKHEEFKAEYIKQVLQGLDPETVKHEIELLTKGKDAILCCYEKPTDFCHRHIVAEWLGISEHTSTKQSHPSLFD